MDLYRLESALYERSHYSRIDSSSPGTHNDLSKQFSNNDILSSSAWSSVIHQPAQDSEPEDLPSTVDIAAIKEPSTPVNASAQTPSSQLHGDVSNYDQSDDQNANESDSESDSDSDSGNSENEAENAGSGADSGSYSDSDSVSSRRSSSSSKEKPHSARSSVSPSLSPVCQDQTSFVSKEKDSKNVSDKESDSDSSSSSNNASPVKMSATLYQEKRGPGRPKKPTPVKINSDTNSGKILTDKVEKSFKKLNDLPRKLTPITNDKTKLQKLKQRSLPVIMRVEDLNKRKKKLTIVANKCSSAFVPVYPKRKKLLHKHRKRKKKQSKKKYVTVEFIKIMEDLVEIFNKKCFIIDKKNIEANQSSVYSALRLKLNQRVKERNNRKRKYSEKSKLSENDSESENNNTVIAANVPNGKRRHEKNTVKTPKMLETNSDQRLPLKKRHYQISASSITINNHQAHNDIKNRNIEKHLLPSSSSSSSSNDLLTSSSSLNTADSNVKVNLKSNATMAHKNNQKSKLSVHKDNNVSTKIETLRNAVKLESLKSIPKLETTKNIAKSESSLKNIVKPEYSKRAVKVDSNSSTSKQIVKSESTRNVTRVDSVKNVCVKSDPPAENVSVATVAIVKSEPPLKNITRSETSRTAVTKLATEHPKNARKSESVKNVNVSKSECTKTIPKVQTIKKVTRSSSLETTAKVTSVAAGKMELVKNYVKSEPMKNLATVKTADKTKNITEPVRHTTTTVRSESLKHNSNNLLKLEPTKTMTTRTAVESFKNTTTKSDKLSKGTSKSSTGLSSTNAAAMVNIKSEPGNSILTVKIEPVNIMAKKNKICKDMSICIEKLPSTEISNSGSSLAVQSPSAVSLSFSSNDSSSSATKPKLKRRKNRNRTGFPVLKKKKKKRNSTYPDPNDVVPNVVDSTVINNCTVSSKLIEVSKNKITVPVKSESKNDNEVENGPPAKIKKVDVAEVSVKESKELRSKKETDKDELSDADSVKGQNIKKVVPPKWQKKKKFSVAGLLSDYHKKEKPPMLDQRNRYSWKPEEHPHGLLPQPPSEFEEWVRRRRIDFKLPYDLWWMHDNNQLPGRDVVQSWNYKKIRTNVYYDVKPTYMYEAQACNCELPSDKNKLGCGEDCINRLVYAECSPQLCPLKTKCSNQKIQKHEWASKLVKFMTTDKGWGVKTKEPIKCGEFILEYVGEVVTDREFKKRMTSLYKNDIHHYCLNLDGGLLIDGHRMGGAGRFVNHSCEPNCEMQKWSVNGLFRMALFALRDIKAGEELSYDYNFALFNPAEGQPCKCGSIKCRGVIGGKYQRVNIGNGNNSVCNTEATNNANGNGNSNGKNITSNGASTDKKQSRIRSRKQNRKNSNVAVNSETGSAPQNSSNQSRRDSIISNNGIGMTHRNVCNLIPVKQLTPKEKKIVQTYHMFLPRNLTKVQRVKETLIQLYNNKENSNTLNQNNANSKTTSDKSENKEKQSFHTTMIALLTQRFIKTRGLVHAEDNPEMTKAAHLANVLRTIYSYVISAKDEKGEPFSSLFMTLPPKKKMPMYYMRIGEPIDLNTIEKNIMNGVYKTVDTFDKDMNRLISNNVKFYGRTSEYGIAAIRLRKEYNIAKLNYAPQIKEIIGEVLPPSFMPEQEDPGDEEEDVIRCICGLYNDEGLMIQCERCLVWQHCDCVRADKNVEHYLCERCSPREVDYEIPLDVTPDYANPGEKHYLTLMREDLQIREGDTVYVLRDIKNPETGTRHTFKTIKNINFEDCDIFRVERLFKDSNGERMSFGHHYLRPHETFHEPTRRFFTNEVVKISLYETVPLDLIMRQCYVLDLSTFCSGRPLDADPNHVYICEFRVDKSARLFFKLRKSQIPRICTKNYAFEKYDVRLKPTRTYAPHGDLKGNGETKNGGVTSTSNSKTKATSNSTPSSSFTSKSAVNSLTVAAKTTTPTTKAAGVKSSNGTTSNTKSIAVKAVAVPSSTAATTVTSASVSAISIRKRLLKAEESKSNNSATSGSSRTSNNENSVDTPAAADEDDVPLAQIKESQVNMKKRRLNFIMLKLLAKNSTKTPLDASYLLDLGKRIRRKPGQFTPPVN